MREFFSIEGPFNKYGGMLADMVLVSFMWILFCLPIITAGAATTAMFFVTTRRISEREGYITSDFWQAFKANFKRGTIMGVIFTLIIVLLILNIFILSSPDNAEMQLNAVMYAAQLVGLVVIIFMGIYIFPLIARFDMKLREVAKSAFYMAIRHFITSIACVALIVLAVFLFFQLPPLLVVLPGAYAWLASIMIMRIFKKYRPEMDKDPTQELAEIEAKKAEERWKREMDTDAIDAINATDAIDAIDAADAADAIDTADAADATDAADAREEN